MIKLADGRGHLYQWDTGRQVECEAKQVHFSNHHYGISIDVDVKNGKATIPNQLLTSAIPLKAWAWVKDDGGEYTKEEQIFLVIKRNKPSDYVYTPTEIKTWQDLQNQIGDLNGLKTEHKDNLVNAINDAAESGGAGDFIIKMTVARDDDGKYTVASCDATVEQIDAAVAAEKRVILLASDDGVVFELPMLQGVPGNFYYFGTFLLGEVVVVYVWKDTSSGISTWTFDMHHIEAEAVDYSNDALPNISTVGGALDELVPKSHTHANKDTLDKLSDSNGKLQYNGSDIGLKPTYYIDLTGTYPNYTCPVTMDDIKAAYNSGYNLVCRCALSAYTATLPLFVPMPALNTWIFSGSGALASMDFSAQSFTVAITSNGVVAQETFLNRMERRLKITVGDKAYFYDGSEAVTVVIDDGMEVSY